MARARYQTFRFLHPEIDAPHTRAGLTVAPSGRLQLVEGDASVLQAILLLLSTKPGERIMRPDYGCDLYKLMFSPNDDTTAGLAMHYVRRALERWEPRIDIVRLDATRNEAEPGNLNLHLEYKVRATQRKHFIEVPINLDAETP